MKRAAVLLLALAVPVVAAPGPLVVQPEIRPTLPGEDVEAKDAVEFRRDYGDRMTVSVAVDGKGPYRFVVDTGSERTVISRELAAKLGLSRGKSTVLHSVIGSNNVDTVNIPHLSVSSNTVAVVDAPIADADHIGADGLLGIDSLRSQQVIFDFRAGTMEIMPGKRVRQKLDGDTVVVRARSRKGRLIFTNASIDGEDVTVIVDTGAQVTIGNLQLKRRFEKRWSVQVPESVTIGSVTGEQMDAGLVMIERLKLDGISLDGLGVAFADAHIFRQLDLDKKPAILLGMNAMRAFDRISIDFAEKKVRFVLPGTSMRETVRMARN